MSKFRDWFISWDAFGKQFVFDLPGEYTPQKSKEERSMQLSLIGSIFTLIIFIIMLVFGSMFLVDMISLDSDTRISVYIEQDYYLLSNEQSTEEDIFKVTSKDGFKLAYQYYKRGSRADGY